MGNLIASCCGTAEYDTATAKSHNSNLSLSSSSIGSEKVLDQEPPSLPPSLPPRIQERKESSSSSSSSSSDSDDDEGGDDNVPEESKEKEEENVGEEANNAIEKSLIVENEQCVNEKDNTDHSDNACEHASDNEEVENAVD
eukprot:TRINITY_DN3345_c0_g1_i3.p1 TRINITY_DN3345_c0_g1~~TRINITY_DN3345_c0_g1_i3.p1  ORF type:complete len:141 (-),score=41.37 TRINITY_DN3345_c0_g1_i3:63-485(-)